MNPRQYRKCLGTSSCINKGAFEAFLPDQSSTCNHIQVAQKPDKYKILQDKPINTYRDNHKFFGIEDRQQEIEQGLPPKADNAQLDLITKQC